MSEIQNSSGIGASVADVPAVALPQTSFDFNAVHGSVKGYMSSANAGKTDLWMIDVDKIKVLEGFNPRIKNAAYEEHVEHLKGLILPNGYDRSKPLSAIVLVKNGEQDIYVYDGHCRLEAVRRAIAAGAEIKQLPVVTAPKGTSIQDLTAALINTGTGMALTPLEKAVVCKRLIGYNWTVQEIAKRLNYTPNYVDQLLSVLQGPREVCEMIQRDEVSLSVALQAIKQHGEKAATVLQGSIDEAKVKGKRRATGGMLPGSKFKKAVRKAAPMLYEASCKLVNSESFVKIPEDLRELFMNLVKDLSQTQLELAEANAGSAPQASESDIKTVSSNVVPINAAVSVQASSDAQINDAAQESAKSGGDERQSGAGGESSLMLAGGEDGNITVSQEVREPDPDAPQDLQHEDYLRQDALELDGRESYQ